jgi:hypothetical protein
MPLVVGRDGGEGVNEGAKVMGEMHTNGDLWTCEGRSQIEGRHWLSPPPFSLVVYSNRSMEEATTKGERVLVMSATCKVAATVEKE